MSVFEYDSNGNIFINKNNEYYILEINKDDDVYFQKIHNLIYNENQKKTKSIITDIGNKLHIKSMEEAVNEIDHNIDLQDYGEDQIQEIADTYNEIKINPEYQYYKNESYELDNECYNDDEPNEFEIYTNSIQNSNLQYEPPFFETIIYKQNKVELRTQLLNNQPFYRINIHLEGKIQLNIIGSKIKFYNFDMNTLEIKKVDENSINLM
jgi:hypothetical protein